MGVATSEVRYTSATTGRGDHEAHKRHVVALEKTKINKFQQYTNTGWPLKHSLIPSSYKIKTYWNIFINMGLQTQEGGTLSVSNTTWNCMSLCKCAHQFCENISVSFDFIPTWNQGVLFGHHVLHKNAFVAN
jgi:hypothetical protein